MMVPASADPASLWRHADFLKLWAGQTASVLGTQVTALALPLVAVLVLDAGPEQLAFLMAASLAPTLLLAPVAGVWVDRLRRRPILIGTDLGRAIVIAAVPVAAVAGVLRIWQLYVVAFLVGSLSALFNIAYRSFLPTLVERSQLVDANARLSASRSVGEVAGPGLAGVLVQVLTAPIAIAINAASFLVSAATLAWVRGRESKPASESPNWTFRRDLGEGLRFVIGHRVLRALAGSAGLFEFFDGALMAVYVIYVTRELGVEPVVLGVIFGVGGAGGLLGAFAAGRIARRFGLGAAMIGGAVLAGVGDALIPVAALSSTVAPYVLAGAELLVGFGAVIYSVNQVSTRQAITPEQIHGRVNALMLMMTSGPALVGALAAGFAAGAVGFVPVLIVAGAGTLTAGGLLLLSPVRDYRLAVGSPSSQPTR